MSDFKLDTAIPLPEDAEIILVNTRGKRNACYLWEHDWRDIEKTDKIFPLTGRGREKCAKCGEIFPCVQDCGHLDCRVVKGQKLPDWISEVPDEVASEPEICEATVSYEETP